MKLTTEKIRQMIMEEIRNLSMEGHMPMGAEDMASPASMAYKNFKSEMMRYMADDVQYDAELRMDAAESAEDAAYAALEAGAEGDMADEISNFLNDLYASGDLN